MKTYNMFYTPSRTNVTLHLDSSSSSPPLYYASVTVMAIYPTVQLHRGDRSGPIASTAKFRWTSRHVHLGLNDPNGKPGSTDGMAWEEMSREKNCLHRSDYVLATSVGSTTGKKMGYRWRQDRSKLVSNVYRCEDDEGRVIGSMLSGGYFNWKKGGEIEMEEGLQKELEELLIVGALAIWVEEAAGSVWKGYGSGQKESRQ